MAHTDLPPRIFEIGLGCFMQFGPGGSAKLWRALFPYEYQRKCGEEWERANPGVAVLHYGDQSSASDLNAATGAEKFDLMVDDGSHMNAHQLISLVTLWPKVAAMTLLAAVPTGTFLDKIIELEAAVTACRTTKAPRPSLPTSFVNGYQYSSAIAMHPLKTFPNWKA
jgi:hypothetical protein